MPYVLLNPPVCVACCLNIWQLWWQNKYKPIKWSRRPQPFWISDQTLLFQTVFISLPHQTLYSCRLEPRKEQTDVQVRVLNCDSISQVKEKALDVIFDNQPFSQRPPLHKLDLREFFPFSLKPRACKYSTQIEDTFFGCNGRFLQ